MNYGGLLRSKKFFHESLYTKIKVVPKFTDHRPQTTDHVTIIRLAGILRVSDILNHSEVKE